MPRLWQRQPDEAPADFTAFIAYLRLKGRRSHRAVAVQTGRSLGAIRRLSARSNWPGRVAAFESRRADAAQDAMDAMVRACASQTKADYERLHVAQFQLAHRVLQESSRWLALASDPRRRNISLTQVARIIALATKLGRLACGLPTGDEPKRRPRPEDAPGYWTGPSVEEALAKIYGPESPTGAAPDSSPAPHQPPAVAASVASPNSGAVSPQSPGAPDSNSAGPGIAPGDTVAPSTTNAPAALNSSSLSFAPLSVSAPEYRRQDAWSRLAKYQRQLAPK